MTTQELILPEEMQVRCMPEPYEFRVLLREIRVAHDIMDDPHFAGFVKLIITSVPMMTDAGDTRVQEEDIRAFIVFGIVEEHPEVLVALQHPAPFSLRRFFCCDSPFLFLPFFLILSPLCIDL